MKAVSGLRCAVLGTLLLMLSSAGGASDTTLFFELELRSGPLPSAVTDNGSTIVGGFAGGGGFYWMPTTGAIFTGGVAATDVSADGRTIVGTVFDRGVRNAAIWQRAAEWRPLGGFAGGAPCDAFLSNATGVSRDGRVVVGSAYRGCESAHAFRWEESTGMVDLGSTAAGRSSDARAVSGDGNVVVGEQIAADSFQTGVRWSGGRQFTIPGDEGRVGIAFGVNHDGSAVVGRQCRPSAVDPIVAQSAWIWTAAGGTRCLPPPGLRLPLNMNFGGGNDVSNDGRIVVGALKVAQSPDSEAVIWIDGVPSYLKDYLRANGVPGAFETWVNTGEITDVSADGRILVGYGAARLGFRGYMVILGRTP